jgi:circadian clock protein KaiC
MQAGSYDLAALLARIEAAVTRVGAARVVVDSLDGLFEQFSQDAHFRNELHRVIARLADLGVTTVLTTERASDYGALSRRGVEEFVTDNLILLRNVLTAEKRRRTIEIVKFRGTGHGTGEFGFSINGSGINVIPHLDIADDRVLTDERISSGNAELDAMCDGGLFRDSVALVSGAAGTGKTLLMTSFVAAGVPWASAACSSRSRSGGSSCSATRAAGASTSRRWSATGCSRSWPSTRRSRRSRITSSPSRP